ncbi:hypothetical protein RQM65_04830 [Pricia sp. S334]|uniref:Secreted protein n=1 Tax=Pricia mediterranea TaxID=3076079 RepID=A0ABU3L3G8_9FLAO|nr:hypothetical protein [Pricia sp. S334]MDT7827987.1 hypothetical protein [Pricia sp. S334]
MRYLKKSFLFLTVLLAALAIYALQNSDTREDGQSSAGTSVDTVGIDWDTLRTKRTGRTGETVSGRISPE